jgi:hypothetical protein
VISSSTWFPGAPWAGEYVDHTFRRILAYCDGSRRDISHRPIRNSGRSMETAVQCPGSAHPHTAARSQAPSAPATRTQPLSVHGTGNSVSEAVFKASYGDARDLAWLLVQSDTGDH